MSLPISRHAPRGRSALSLWVPLFLMAGCAGQKPESPASASDTPPEVVQLTDAEVRAADITTDVVEARSVRQEVSVPGSVQSPDTAHAMVGSFVEGRVLSVMVLAGDEVRRGQPLVEIHSHELSDAQAALRGAEAELTFHRNALERSEALLAAGAVALEEVERRRADLEITEAEVSRTADIVEHLNPSPDGDVTIIAPRDGTVFSVQARPGQAVVPGVPLVEMGSTDVLWVTAFVPEHTASTLTSGDRVIVRFTAPPGEATAHLVRAGNYIDAANRSVEMRFELDAIPAGVRPVASPRSTCPHRIRSRASSFQQTPRSESGIGTPCSSSRGRGSFERSG